MLTKLRGGTKRFKVAVRSQSAVDLHLNSMTYWVLALVPSKFAAAPGFSIIAIFKIELNLYCFGAAQGSLALYMANQDGSYIAGVFRVCVLSAILNFLASLVRQCRLPIIAD